MEAETFNSGGLAFAIAPPFATPNETRLERLARRRGRLERPNQHTEKRHCDSYHRDTPCDRGSLRSTLCSNCPAETQLMSVVHNRAGRAALGAQAIVDKQDAEVGLVGVAIAVEIATVVDLIGE